MSEYEGGLWFVDLGNTSTILFDSLADHLTESGVHTGVIYFNRRKFAAASRSNRRRVLIDFGTEGGEGLEATLKGLREEFPGLTYGRLLSLDRYLIGDWTEGDRVLRSFHDQFLSFLDTVKPEMVVGEIALGTEVLAYHMAIARDIPYLVPTNLFSLGKPRFTLMDLGFSWKHVERLASLLAAESKPRLDGDLATDRRNASINESLGRAVRRPYGIKILRRLVYNSRHRDPADYRAGAGYRLKNRFNSLARGLALRAYWATRRPEPRDRFVLLPLHVQPEATPDTLSPIWSNQFEVARTVATNLPPGVRLVVKEHPNHVGCRSLAEVRRFERLPFTHTVAASTDMKELIGAAECVVTVAGTASLEAALAGVPAVVLSNVYYGDLPGVRVARSRTELAAYIANEEWQTTDSATDAQFEAFLSTCAEASFDAYFHQPLLVDGVEREPNLSRLVAAIDAVYRALQNNESWTQDGYSQY